MKEKQEKKQNREEVDENGLTYGDIHVEWNGWDGILVGLYVTLSCIYGFGVINRIDWIVGIMAPLTCLIITWSVFFRYCTEVLHFMKRK